MPSRQVQLSRESLLNSLPSGFAENVALGVLEAYDEASQTCSTNFADEGRTLRPHLLLAVVERNVRQRLRGVAGISMCSEKNAARNCEHLVIKYEHLVITISALESRRALPRHADFRESLAKSAQGELFAPDDADAARVRTKLYLLVVHGPAGAATPSFLDLVPPTNTCDDYVENARINLLAEATRATNRIPAAASAEVVAPAAAELRDDIVSEDKQA